MIAISFLWESGQLGYHGHPILKNIILFCPEIMPDEKCKEFRRVAWRRVAIEVTMENYFQGASDGF